MNPIPIQLSDASGVPYYRQVVDQVAELVRSGQLAPGSLLPSVRELAAQLLVSLITVRNAYAELEHAGLIVRRQGFGTYVAEDVKAASSEQTRAEARELLAGVVARARRMGIGDEALRELLAELLEQGGHGRVRH